MKQDAWQNILRVLPPPLGEALKRRTDGGDVTELRVRCGSFASITRFGKAGSERIEVLTDARYCRRLLDNLSQHGLYRIEEKLKAGCLTLAGGVRVGVTGITQETSGLIFPVTSFCFRVPREVVGCAKELMKNIYGKNGYESTLIVSPPGAGKTTMLRDMIRIASDDGLCVAVADERHELCAMDDGGTAFDLGSETDVMSAMPKSHAIMRMLRSMAPQVIVCDEIGSKQDAAALAEACRCGVRVFASAHAWDEEALVRRETLRECLQSGAFSKIAVLDEKSRGRVKRIVSVEEMIKKVKAGSI